MIIQRMADVLGVPAAYLFASDERLARLIFAYNAMPRKAQEQLVFHLEWLAGK
jgi:hypothetical protein